MSFERLNLFSIAITTAIALAIGAYCRLIPSKSFYWTTRHMMQYLGFVHFAVGYHFFLTSRMIRPQLVSGNPGFFLKLMGCLAVSTLFYKVPEWQPVVYALFYLHAAENSVYHLFKLGQYPAGSGQARVSGGALFPLLLVLIIIRLSPQYATFVNFPMGFARLGVLFFTLAFLRFLLPSTQWKTGWGLVRRQHVLIAWFFIVSFLFAERFELYDFFIIWHYVIWFLYTWIQRPLDRTRLVWSHLLFAIIYKALFLTADAGVRLFHPLTLWLLIGPVSFMAQTACHILITLVFRKYPSAMLADRPNSLRVAPAV